MFDLENFNHLGLEKIPLFNGLNENELHQIFQAARRKKCAEDEFFFFQGDPANHMYVLTSGRVRLFQTSADGDQVLIHVITPVRLFALVAMTQTQVYPVSAQAAESSEAIYWGRDMLMDFVLRYPALAVNAMRIMAEQVKEMQERLRQATSEHVDQRLARALIRLSSEFGKKVEEGILIDIPLTRQELAEMAGTTLFTVSRILNQWEEQGYVICGRERVSIRYPHGLLQIIERSN
jgi:CRP-like cAMP-binding protein